MILLFQPGRRISSRRYSQSHLRFQYLITKVNWFNKCFRQSSLMLRDYWQENYKSVYKYCHFLGTWYFSFRATGRKSAWNSTSRHQTAIAWPIWRRSPYSLLSPRVICPWAVESRLVCACISLHIFQTPLYVNRILWISF